MRGDLTRQSSNHPGVPELLALLRKCSKDTRKILIDAVTGLSRLDEAPVMQPFPQEDVDRFNVRIQPVAPSSTQSTHSLGMLGRLPTEIHMVVLEFLDIRTLLRFSRTCRLARILVHEHPDFRLVTNYANNVFLGLIATRLHKYRSLGNIIQVLRTPKCHNPACHQFGELVYLPDMIRSCIDCLEFRARTHSRYPRTHLVTKVLARRYPEYFSFVPDRVPAILVRRPFGRPVRKLYMHVVDRRLEGSVPHWKLRRLGLPPVPSFPPYDKEPMWTVLNLGDLVPQSGWELEPWVDERTGTTVPASIVRTPISEPLLATSIAVPYLADRGRGEVVERGVCCLGCGDMGGCMLPEYFLEEHLPWCLKAWGMLMDKLMKTREGGKEDEKEDESQQGPQQQAGPEAPISKSKKRRMRLKERKKRQHEEELKKKQECQKLLEEVKPLIDDWKKAQAVNGRSL